MQTTGISKDLSLAINFLEELLNNKDSATIIETIKNYKESKNSNNHGLINYNID
ncbi:MAG TPA: hypothetical protein P5556_09370 [Candidatus Gastranaerophilales bacterium]|nr:hypothetical protein [Candidatus Gastranaerophilales bacterium]